MNPPTLRIDKKEKMYSLIRDQSVSGLSVKEYCQQHRLSVATFYYWYKKINREQLTIKSTPINTPFSLLVAGETVTEGKLYAEYKGIRFYQEPSAGLLKSLIG